MLDKVLNCLADAAWHDKPVDTSSLTALEKGLLPSELSLDETPTWEVVFSILEKNMKEAIDCACICSVIGQAWLARRKVEFTYDDVPSDLPRLLLPVAARIVRASWQNQMLVLTEEAQETYASMFEDTAKLEDQICKMRGDDPDKLKATMELLKAPRFKWPDS